MDDVFKMCLLSFLCRFAELITKAEIFKTLVMYGEMSVIPLDQLTTMVDNVRQTHVCYLSS